MGPPSRARARRHRVLVVWLGVLLLIQRSISTTAAPRRVNHTNNINNINATATPRRINNIHNTNNTINISNINTTPAPTDYHVTSNTPTDSDVTSNTPNNSHVISNTPNDSHVTSNTPKDSYVISNTPSNSHLTSNTPNNSHVTNNNPNDFRMTSNTPNNSHVSRRTPNDSHVTGNATTSAPNDSRVISTTPKDSHVIRSTRNDSHATSSTPNYTHVTTITPNDSRVTSNATPSTSNDSLVTSSTPNDSHVTSNTPNGSLETHNAATLNSSDSDLHLIAFVFGVYVTPALASVGLAGNVVSFVVWSGEREFNPATFFIKALSVADMVFLIKPLAGLAVSLIYVIPLYIYGSITSVHLTLALVVSRWLSVHRPLHVHRLLTKSRTVASLVLLVLWCGAAATYPLMLVCGFGTVDPYTDRALMLTLITVGWVLPILMLAFFNVSLVRFMCRRSHHAGGISPSPNRRQREARAKQLRRLVAVVVCVSVTTLLTYPVALATLVISIFLEQPDVYPFILSLIDLLMVFNSAVTPLYYALFASRFRELFWIRWKSCHVACRNPPCVPGKRRSRTLPPFKQHFRSLQSVSAEQDTAPTLQHCRSLQSVSAEQDTAPTLQHCMSLQSVSAEQDTAPTLQHCMSLQSVSAEQDTAPTLQHCMSLQSVSAEQDTAPTLQHYRSLQSVSVETWPRPTTLREKLHRPAGALRKMTNFIRRADLQV